MEAFARKFEDMYKAHYSLLRNAAENIVSDPDASHDIVQEVFLKLWHKQEDPAFILNQRSYLLRAVINASITHLQKNKNKVRINELKIEASENSDSSVNAKELESNIKSALDKLPARCKAIFVLSRFEGMKNKDIAKTLGVSLKTVENQMGIALKKMRDELKAFFGSELITVSLGAGLAFLMQLLNFS